MNFLTGEKDNRTIGSWLKWEKDMDLSLQSSEVQLPDEWLHVVSSGQEFNPNVIHNFIDYMWHKAISGEAESQFQEELEKKKKLIAINEAAFRNALNYFLNALAYLNPAGIEVSITLSTSLYLRFRIKDIYTIRMECFLEDLEDFDRNVENTVLTIEKDMIQEFGFHGSPVEAISELGSFLQPLLGSYKSSPTDDASYIDDEPHTITE